MQGWNCSGSEIEADMLPRAHPVGGFAGCGEGRAHWHASGGDAAVDLIGEERHDFGAAPRGPVLRGMGGAEQVGQFVRIDLRLVVVGVGALGQEEGRRGRH